jgi:hypothetical protein
MRLLFEERGGALTAAVSQVRVQNARNGVNLPFHPQADAYLKANAVPAKPAASR